MLTIYENILETATFLLQYSKFLFHLITHKVCVKIDVLFMAKNWIKIFDIPVVVAASYVSYTGITNFLNSCSKRRCIHF